MIEFVGQLASSLRDPGTERVLTVEAVTANDLDRVLPLLRAHDDLPDDGAWRRLIQPPWADPGAAGGWMLLHGSMPVGFLGAVFSEQRIDGIDRRFCNLTTWYVHPNHRESSLALLRPAVRLRDHTITDLSPNEAAERISRRLGFVDLDTNLLLLGRPGDRSRRPSVEVRLDEPGAREALPDDVRRRSSDHLGIPGVHQLVVDSPDGPLLIVCTRVTRGRRPYTHVHHVSDAGVLRAHYATIHRAIVEGLGDPVITDARFRWASGLPGVRRLVENSPKLYRPCDDLAAHQIDNLYSELVLLGFPQLPPSAGPLGQRVKARVKRAIDPSPTPVHPEGGSDR